MKPNKRKAQSKLAAKNVSKTHKRLLRNRMAVKDRQLRKEKYWNDTLDQLNSMSLTLVNREGRARSYFENCMVILAIIAALKRAIKDQKR